MSDGIAVERLVRRAFRRCHVANAVLHAASAILYNHESPRRPPQFVTKKIVQNMLGVARKRIDYFEIGDLSAVRDWGYARDYAQGLWLMVRQAEPKDYILATGEGHTVEEFMSQAAQAAGVPDWRNSVRVKTDFAPGPPRTILVGDPSRASSDLGWKSTVSFPELVDLMTKNEAVGALD